MKCTITIETTNFEELKAISSMLSPNHYIPDVKKMEDDIDILTDKPQAPIVVPDLHQVKQIPPPLEIAAKPLQLPVKTEIACAGCKKTFVPKNKLSKYCSDKCSQRAYTATYMNKKIQTIASSPVPVPVPDPPEPETKKVIDIEAQNRKLKELREKFPVTRERPNIQPNL